jgi:hypothetical protein
VRLSNPTHIRLTPELQHQIDGWRGDRMNRATAIRLLLEQALDVCTCDGILPATK